jgi:cell division protein ZapA (FtsZ GTPase activity inhibitor)
VTDSERNLEQAVAELHERSRKSTRILVIGMLLIVASLLASAFYLNQLRTRAEQQARDWKTKAENLELTVKQASESRNPEETRALLTSAESQTQELAAVAAEAAGAEVAQPEPPSGPVLLYIRVSEEEQQVAALALESRLEAARLGDRPILVPRMGIAATSGLSSLRCYTPADCDYADDLLRVVTQQMPAPPVHVLNLSDRHYKVPPGMFELWLAPGPIELN